MAVEPQPPSVQNKKHGVFLLLVAGFVLAICLESARAPTHAFAWPLHFFRTQTASVLYCK